MKAESVSTAQYLLFQRAYQISTHLFTTGVKFKPKTSNNFRRYILQGTGHALTASDGKIKPKAPTLDMCHTAERLTSLSVGAQKQVRRYD